MQNNFLSKWVFSLSLFTLILVQESVYSQSTSTSPFSSYGLGQRDGLDDGVYSGIGTTTITYFDSTNLNFFNPASYHTIGKGQPIFSTGVSSRLSWYSDSINKNFSKAIVLNHFAMGFSFAKHFGFAFGLKPFSRRGYQFSTKSLLVTDSMNYTYLGSGSTSEVFVGLSSNVLKYKSSQLSIGGNVGYVFGSLINERRSNIVGSNAGGIEQKTLKLTALHYELGMYYKHEINKNNSLIFSAVMEPNQNMKAVQTNDLYYSSLINNSDAYTKLDSSSISGSISITPTSTFGFSYRYGFDGFKKSEMVKKSEISFHASYNITNWKDNPTKFSGTNLNSGYINTNKLTLGVQYIPNKMFFDQTNKSTIFEIIRYRIGYYQYNLPMIINSKTLLDKGVTLGFGIPLKVQKSLSSINLGLTYGKRGDGSSSNLNEKYLGVNISVIFAPASFERWFVKRKLD